MIANYQQPGAAIDYTNPTGDTIKAGQVVSLTTRIGIAGTEIPAAAVGSLHLKGSKHGSPSHADFATQKHSSAK